MTGAVLSRTLAAVFYKVAAQHSGRTLVAYFTAGLVVGILYPICTTLALYGNHPNLVFATMAGLGGIVFVVVMDRVFRGQLSARQWLGIALIVVSTVVLQLPASSGESPPGDSHGPTDQIPSSER